VEAAGYILRRLSALGYEARVQSFQIDSDRVGHNILAGAPANGVLNVTNYKSASKVKPLIVLLAYYDGLGILSGRMYPCADSNASGVAALLSIAERVKGREDVLMVFLDGHNANLSGAAALRKALKGRRIALVANIDIIGSTLAPVDKYWPDFLIALGAERHRLLLEECNKGLQLHYYHTYYRSRTFSDLFYRRAGDHKDFLADGHHSILFTSGITDNTNKPSDTFDTLDYEVFAKRVEFISRFIENYGRSYY
jgi:Zn-dependent M28 family amino/carboxypeptidase